jgi:predicted nucleic acid-binding protein
MKIVADTSVFLAVAMGEPERDAIVRRTRDSDLVAPELLPYEIGNALSSLARRGKIDGEQAIRIWEITRMIPVELKPVDIRRALDIALAHRLYAYDAYFLECARRARAPLLTLDRKMRSVAVDQGLNIVDLG